MRISLIGLGWLGLPLASFLQGKGHVVKGTTTSPEKQKRLEQEGMVAECLLLDPLPATEVPAHLFDTDLLYINIPPGRRRHSDAYHPRQIHFLREAIERYGLQKVIYVSATSVYPSKNQVARETDSLTADTTGNPALWNAEQLLWKDKSYELTVVRFGGLLGDDRIPGRYFSGKENVPGHPPVNYIHRTDAVRAIHWIISQNLWNETYNIVSPEHPEKRAVFEKNARDMGFPPPASYEEPPQQMWKEISCEKWLRTGFSFDFPDPLAFTYKV